MRFFHSQNQYLSIAAFSVFFCLIAFSYAFAENTVRPDIDSQSSSSVIFSKDEAPKYNSELDTQLLPFEEIIIEKADGSNIALSAEIARTVEQKRIGLMNRDILPENTGMLFLFKAEKERHFWMKNTRIPLDLIFIKRDGTIFHIHDNAVPFSLERIPSRGPALAVLEIAGGEAERLGIGVSDKVIARYFTYGLNE